MTDDEKRFHVDGKGFDKGEFDPDERATLRHLRYRIEREFLSAEDFLMETGLMLISNIAKGIPSFLRVAGGVTALGAAFLGGKTLGWW